MDQPGLPLHRRQVQKRSLQALQRYAVSRQIVWLSIDTAAPDKAGYLTPAAARARIAQTRATVTAFLFDVDGHIARSYGAKTTPSFFVVIATARLPTKVPWMIRSSPTTAQGTNT